MRQTVFVVFVIVVVSTLSCFISLQVCTELYEQASVVTCAGKESKHDTYCHPGYFKRFKQEEARNLNDGFLGHMESCLDEPLTSGRGTAQRGRSLA